MATFLGCDVSQFQGAINWTILKNSVSFAIIKASGGDANLYTDSRYRTNRTGAENNGVSRGYYHFFSNGVVDPVGEANYFSSIIGTPNTGDLLILDAEGNGVFPGDCKQFLDQVSSNFNGYKPGIYLNLGLVRSQDWSAVVAAGYFLWLADWTGSPNFGIGASPWASYSLHQYSDSGGLPGIGGRVDLDAFNGTTMADFTALGVGGSGGGGVPTPPPPSITTPSAQSASSSYTQAAKQAIAIPTYNYDKLIYATEFTYATHANASPASISTGINQAAYPIGIYSTDGGNTWQDLGMGIEPGTFGWLGGSLIPDVFLTASVDTGGTISFTSNVNTGYAYEVTVRVALLATSSPGSLTSTDLVNPEAFSSVTKLSSYNTYRRIAADTTTPGNGTSQTLTTVGHNQPTIPIPNIWHINSDGSITHQSNQYDSRGESQSPNPAILLDGSNIYFNNNSALNFRYGYRLYKDNT